MFWNKPRPKNHLLGAKNSRKPCNPRLFNYAKLSNINKLEADIL